MALFNELETSYLVPENARDVSKIFYRQNFPKTPMLNAISIGASVGNTKHYWWEDVLLPRGTTVLAGNAYTSGDPHIDVTAYLGIKVGTVLKVSSATGVSLLRCSATPSSTAVTIDPLDNDQSHAAGSTIEFLGNANAEGASFTMDGKNPAQEVYNVTQILTKYLEVSGSEQAVSREVDPGSLIDINAAKKLAQLYFEMGKMIWANARIAPANNATERMFGGIPYFIDLYGYTPSAAAFSAANFDAFLLEAEQNQGCDIVELWMNPTDMARFIALDDSKRRIDNAVRTAGTPMAKTYLSQNGYEIPLFVDPNIPAKKIMLCDSSKISLRPLQTRQFQIIDVATAADKMAKAIVGEYTLEVNPSNTMGIFEVS
jgi:hypothetical protein